MKKEILSKAADNIRILSAAMVEKAKSGHPGGAMGGADFVSVLFSEFMRFDPGDMGWANRDRFFLDPGHMSPMLYSMLTLTGNFTVQELENFLREAEENALLASAETISRALPPQFQDELKLARGQG